MTKISFRKIINNKASIFSLFKLTIFTLAIIFLLFYLNNIEV